MKAEFLVSFAAALLCHGFLLFGWRLGSPARPLAMSEDAAPVEVNLVAAAPAPSALEPAPEPAATPMPSPEETPIPEPPSTPGLDDFSKSTPLHEKPKSGPRAVNTPDTIVSTSKTGGNAPANPGGGSSSTQARPRYRSNPTPEYPPEARRLHQQGVVLVSVEVSVEGRATAVALRRSSGVASLDQAALAAVRRWTFEPARVGGLALASRGEVPVRFTLSTR